MNCMGTKNKENFHSGRYEKIIFNCKEAQEEEEPVWWDEKEEMTSFSQPAARKRREKEKHHFECQVLCSLTDNDQ